MNYGYFIETGIPGDDIENIKKFLSKLRPMHIILMRGNFSNKRELASLISKINKFYINDLKLNRPVFSIDQEGGNVIRISDIDYLPSNYCLGFINRADISRMAGLITGSELRSIGILWNHAPVLDLLESPKNPVILERSFGKNSKKVSKLGKSYINGLQSAGVAATAKHFPGHGGVIEDSHLTMPVDNRNINEIKTSMMPFVSAINSGVKSIMLSHVLYSSIDDVPASLSKRINDILRRDLNFTGVSVTDSIDMKALSSNFSIREIAMRSNADIIESVDPETSIELMDFIKFKDINRDSYKRIINLVPDHYIKMPDKGMSFISYMCVKKFRGKYLSKDIETDIIFMPNISRTLVETGRIDYKNVISMLKKRIKRINIFDYENYNGSARQVIIIGRNLHIKNYELKDLTFKKRSFYISTGINCDINNVPGGTGYISCFSTKPESVYLAILRAFGLI
ncbi:glycoside hydrolase family 3 N-terminal domain-containing protein [Picrophilus oshimae]|uniref:beta-N-acetylhexosaminidase n=1 Tax=Picrophilus torridus (strain ATCC 700027 / DSM 9790 / JCM 10055 / NBRC 100828 / KAW 2/3) TaxID=1122961 RepID=A0A8G2L7S2_PICTO|nr:glycoside hydrolase family 3 N-terminal domain-containing protein [Picrophilus oshimae]SMD31408.1 beta-N-acetylhexosaminidase [Picrophilus oshimae DSM 9789]